MEANTIAPPGSTQARWTLIVCAAFVQVVSGAVYAMGAWQSALRDALGLDTAAISSVGAATFAGSVIAMLGGRAFDSLGPRVACGLGALLFTSGYTCIGLAVVFVDHLPPAARVALPALGCALAGYSSVSLLDNVVCMACSLSFPKDRAAIVGYLKAVLASAAGFWALLWVHVFRDSYGLPIYIAFTAASALCATLLCLIGLNVLPPGPDRRAFDGDDAKRLAFAIAYTVALALFSVVVSFCYSNGIVHATSALGYAAVGLALLPLTLLPLPSSGSVLPASSGTSLSEPLMPATEGGAAAAAQGMTAAAAQGGGGGGGEGSSSSSSSSSSGGGKSALRKLKAAGMAAMAATPSGVRFGDAIGGFDFWLLFSMQLAVFGGGVAANQNLALIFESARSPAASGLGVALFALASTVSRVSVGVLSDQYAHRISRFGWLVLVSALAVVGQLLLAVMSPSLILSGTFVLGLSFGSFFTLIVPVVNEMYGQRHFGVIMGSQLGSQALASFAISVELMPTVYRMNTRYGDALCYGAGCFLDSFLALAALNALGLCASIVLARRNKDSMPVDRLPS